MGEAIEPQMNADERIRVLVDATCKQGGRPEGLTPYSSGIATTRAHSLELSAVGDQRSAEGWLRRLFDGPLNGASSVLRELAARSTTLLSSYPKVARLGGWGGEL